MNTKEKLVLQYIKDCGDYGATSEDIALHFTGEAKLHLFSSPLSRLKQEGFILRTNKSRLTENNCPAAVYIANNKGESTLNKPKSVNQGLDCFKSQVHSVSLEFITHDVAVDIYNRGLNTANRAVTNSAKKRAIKKAMKEGKFTPNSMLMFSTDGILLDGHHRLESQVETGTDQTYVVQKGCQYSWVYNTDIGKSRTMSDSLRMSLKQEGLYEELKIDTRTEIIIKNFMLHKSINIDTGRKLPMITGSGLDNKEVLDWVSKTENALVAKEIVTLYEEIKNLKDVFIKDNLLTKSKVTGYRAIWVALTEIMYLLGKDAAVEVAQELFSSEQTTATSISVSHKINDYQRQSSLGKLDVKQMEHLLYGLIIFACNAMMDGDDKIQPTSRKLPRKYNGKVVGVEPLYLLK